MKTNTLHNNSKPDWIYLLFFVLVFPLVYYKLFTAGFISWDDPEILLANRDVHQFSVKQFFTNFYVGNYHPVTMLNYAIDWQLFGKSALGYHAENILWHLINTVLVYFIAKELKLKQLQALLLSAVFAFHPLQLETIAWVAERKTLLYSFFFLLAIWYYLKYKQQSQIKSLTLVYVCFILSLLSKPAAVVFPLLLMALDVFIYQENLKVTYKRYILFFVIALVFGVITIKAQQEAKFLLNTHDYNVFYKIGIFGYGIFHYIYKFMLPINLSAFYGYPDKLIVISVIGVLMIIALVFAVYLLIKRKHYLLLFAVSFFVINIILVLQIISFGDAIVADRYMYLPVIGLTLALIYLFGKHQYLKIPAVAVVVIFSIASFARAAVWVDSLTLFKDTLKKEPGSFLVLNSLGSEYTMQGNPKQAIPFLNKAIAVAPDYYKGYYNRGLAYVQLQQNDKALDDFNKAINYHKQGNHAKSYVARANVYYNLKDFTKAIKDAEKALSIDAKNSKANFLLGNCYDDLNDLPKALSYYNTSIQLNPEEPLFYLRRAVLFGKEQKFNECLADLNTCTTINENFAEAYYWKGVAKVSLKQNPCDDLKKAVKLGFSAAYQPLQNYCR